jgi:RNA polymerase sigma factor (TIGR02999 family)
MLAGMTDVTQILNAIEQGDPHAAEQLLPLVYDELRKLAAQKLAQEKPGQTLQATALVHEAYLRLVKPGRESESRAPDVSPGKNQQWNSRGHFFAAAAEAMRRILVDNARRKQRPKHGGGLQRVEWDEACCLADDGAEQVLLVNDALDKLAQEAPEKAAFVKLRFFAGLSAQEAAEAMGISRATGDRYWSYAKVFLYCALEDARNS